MKKVTLKDVFTRLKYRFKYLLAFSFICFFTIGIIFALGKCSVRIFLYGVILLPIGFLFAIIFLPETMEGPND